MIRFIAEVFILKYVSLMLTSTEIGSKRVKMRTVEPERESESEFLNIFRALQMTTNKNVYT